MHTFSKKTTALLIAPSVGLVPFQNVLTAADGTYDLGGLPGGTYTLGFSDPTSGISEFWNDKATLDAADSLVVTNDGTQNGIDATLATPVEPTPTPTITATANATATTTTTASPAPVVTAMKTIAVLRKPVIKGTPQVGNRLRVTAGTINPTAVVRKIQWLANGKVITKATRRRFVVTSKQAGKKLTVKIKISAPGYTTVVLKTKATGKVIA